MIPVAITSLPPIAADLSWYTWYFWQQLGWLTLLGAYWHVQFIYIGDWGLDVKWAGHMWD